MRDVVMFCGIRPGPGGTGRFVEQLQREAAGTRGVRWILGPEGGGAKGRLGRVLLRVAGRLALRNELRRPAAARSGTAVLIHPQSLGFEWIERFFECWRGPVWYPILDSSFFCVRSYNHLEGERGACLRCLGNTGYLGREHGCRPQGRGDSARAYSFAERLRVRGASGQIGFLVQNDRQLQLVRDHFGGGVRVKRLGMWVSDVEESLQLSLPAEHDNGTIVYHGSDVEAKGFRWALELAAATPAHPFLFPVRRPSGAVPVNASFRPMTWSTGLWVACARASAVLVPSLWSAPVEGSLLKSLAVAPRVAVVAERSSFSDEIPSSIIGRLPSSPDAAATVLEMFVSSPPRREAARDWLKVYRKSNHLIFNRLLDAIGAG